MSQEDAAKALKRLVVRLKKAHPEATATLPSVAVAAPAQDAGVAEVVYSFMLWEAGAAAAAGATRALLAELVDVNELRVCLVSELVSLIGTKYARAEARCADLRRVLNGLFEREHAVTLAPLREMPKRNARAYLDALPGMNPFVAGRVMLLHLEGHAFPLDERLLATLVTGGVCEAEPVDRAAARMERLVRAEDARETYALLEAAVSKTRPAAAARARGAAPSRRTKRAASGPGATAD